MVPSKLFLTIGFVMTLLVSSNSLENECKECRPSFTCIPKLNIRDKIGAPIPVPVPEIRYEVKWIPIEVPVRDFDAQEILVPKTVQLYEEKCRVEPTFVERPVPITIKVPRVVTNIVYHVVNRTKIRTVYKKRAKPIPCTVKRQVPMPNITYKPTQAMKTKIIEKKIQRPIPTRVFTNIECNYHKVDFPVKVPTTEFKYCEDIIDIKVNGTCDIPDGGQNNGYLPPHNTLNKREATPVPVKLS